MKGAHRRSMDSPRGTADRTYRLSVEERIVVGLYRAAGDVTKGLVAESLVQGIPTGFTSNKPAMLLLGAFSTAHLSTFLEKARARILHPNRAVVDAK